MCIKELSGVRALLHVGAPSDTSSYTPRLFADIRNRGINELMMSDLLRDLTDMMQPNVRDRKPPASKFFIRNLESIKPSGGETCAICVEAFDTAAVQLPCKHLFHKDCVIPWLQIVSMW